jgi:multidrug efflux system membrane fusion protein
MSATMQVRGRERRSLRARLISLAVILVAVVAALAAARYVSRHPSTDAASIDADVVHVAAASAGRIIEIAVSENARVVKDALLFQIDPVPYQIVVAQAEADLHLTEAQLETQRRILSTQRSTATVAADQVRKASTNYELATRTTKRLRPLTASGYVPQQQLDQAEVIERDARTALRQAEEQQAAAEQAVDTEAAAEALVSARRAALALAQRNLADTTVRAPHDGLVVGLTVASGEYVIPGQALFTLINTEEWYAVANFRETDLAAIAPGACATVYSMIDRQRGIRGVVDGIGWGVLDEERVNLPRSVPYVERSLNWVRVAQRFPVRIQLEDPPHESMRLGASAVVQVSHGARCP